MLRVMNRLVLAVLGVGLILLGAGALVGAADLPNRWGFGMPSWWSWSRPDEVVLTAGDRTQWRDERWWWPVVITVLAVLVLLALWWLLAQLRRRRTGELRLRTTDAWSQGGADASGPDAVLRARALEQVMAAEAEALDGVARGRATLVGKRSAPRVRVGLLLDEHAVPDTVVHQLDTEVLEHARTSSGVGEIPAEVRLRAVRHRASRVS